MIVRPAWKCSTIREKQNRCRHILWSTTPRKVPSDPSRPLKPSTRMAITPQSTPLKPSTSMINALRSTLARPPRRHILWFTTPRKASSDPFGPRNPSTSMTYTARSTPNRRVSLSPDPRFQPLHPAQHGRLARVTTVSSSDQRPTRNSDAAMDVSADPYTIASGISLKASNSFAKQHRLPTPSKKMYARRNAICRGDSRCHPHLG